MDLKKWAYTKHFKELELKTLKKRDKANAELRRIRKELKQLESK